MAAQPCPQVHSEIFHTLEGPQDGVLPPSLSNDNLLINELIRDYLSYNGYGNALGVFMTESGQPNDRVLDREFLRGEVWPEVENAGYCRVRLSGSVLNRLADLRVLPS